MKNREIPFGVGLLGCGRISSNHIQAFSDHRDLCTLKAVCDIKSARAEAVGKATGAKAYTRYKDLLADPAVDVVSIATPSGLHPEHGILAARAGKHIVVEKPIGVNLKAVDELIRTCDHEGVQLFVIKQNRLNATMQLLKRAVEKGRFGRIYMAQSNVFWQRPQEYYDQARWRATWEFDGGAFMNQASHYVDSLHWLLGEVESVMAMTGTLARRIEAEDTGSAVIRFRNHAIATINVTMLTYPKNFEGSITILGEQGTVKLGGIALNRIEKWEFDSYDDDDRLVNESNYTPSNVYGNGHSTYFKNVFEVLLGRAEPETDGRHGRKAVELVLAIYRSAKQGRQVSLPLDV